MAQVRYYIKQTTTRVTYRDSRGRFVSKAKAIEQGLIPKVKEVTIYRTDTGAFAKESVVQKSKKKVVDVIDKSQTGLSYQSVLGQSLRRNILESVVGGEKIGFIYKNRFYEVGKKQLSKIERSWNQIYNSSVDRFKEGNSLYFTIDIGLTKGKLVIDFDSLIPTEMKKSSEEFKQGKRLIDKDIRRILRSNGLI